MVKTGAGLLVSSRFTALAGRRIGLITNQTGLVDSRHLVDLIVAAGAARLTAIFAPEHGFRGTAEAGANVANDRDAKTGVPIFSLHGNVKAPDNVMLRDVDVLLPYLAEDLLYQIAPGQPLITSRDQFAKRIGPFLKRLESVHSNILRSYAVAPVVLNERIDSFNAPPGGRSQEFHIAGNFLIADGVIKEWKDWPVPGTKQKVGNSIRVA
mgnify:CR=1 FL=1